MKSAGRGSVPLHDSPTENTESVAQSLKETAQRLIEFLRDGARSGSARIGGPFVWHRDRRDSVIVARRSTHREVRRAGFKLTVCPCDELPSNLVTTYFAANRPANIERRRQCVARGHWYLC